MPFHEAGPACVSFDRCSCEPAPLVRDRMMHDRPLGRLLSRREALRRLVGGAAWLITGGMLARESAASGPSPVCLFRPEQTEGPYFVDEELRRSDIRPDPATGQHKCCAALVLAGGLRTRD